MNVHEVIHPLMNDAVERYAMGHKILWDATTTMMPDPSGQPQFVAQCIVTVMMASPILGSKEGLSIHTVLPSLMMLTHADVCDAIVKQLIDVLLGQRSAALGLNGQLPSSPELTLPPLR